MRPKAVTAGDGKTLVERRGWWPGSL